MAFIGLLFFRLSKCFLHSVKDCRLLEFVYLVFFNLEWGPNLRPLSITNMFSLVNHILGVSVYLYCSRPDSFLSFGELFLYFASEASRWRFVVVYEFIRLLKSLSGENFCIWRRLYELVGDEGELTSGSGILYSATDTWRLSSSKSSSVYMGGPRYTTLTDGHFSWCSVEKLGV